MAIGIGGIDLNGGITMRTQDFSTIKGDEENKANAAQLNIQSEQDKETEAHTRQVRNADDSNNNQRRFDAREKGSNEYESLRKKKKKKQDATDGDKATLKDRPSGFDIRI